MCMLFYEEYIRVAATSKQIKLPTYMNNYVFLFHISFLK